jgi:nucleoside-diphosphate-sugar epimerase
MTQAGTIVFGGSGFLGSSILNAYPDIVSVGRTKPRASNRHIPVQSLADLDCLQGVPFDKVIYIIGNTNHASLERETIPRGEPTAFDYHVIPLLQTLEQLKQYPIKKFVHFSTVFLYDDKNMTLPVSEHAPIDPYKTRYVMSKYMAEEVSKFYSKQMPIITIRLANLYGPTPLKRWDVINGVCRGLLETGRTQLWSTRPERDFIHVEDTAHAIVQLLDTDYTGTLNLGTGTMTSLARVKEILEQVSGGTIEVLDKPVSGPTKFQCDMTTINRLIEWTPRSIEAGLRSTFEAMRDNLGPAFVTAKPEI